jgi:hypothetical protein
VTISEGKRNKLDYSVSQVGVWEERTLKWGLAGGVYKRNEGGRKKTKKDRRKWRK